MKISKAMAATIGKMEKMYGKLKRDYFVDQIGCNRVGGCYYDGCELTSDTDKNLCIVVDFDGTHYNVGI